MALHIPSPPVSGLRIGPLDIHVYGLMYVIGITLAVLITRRRWSAVNGDPALVADVAIWAVPAGIIGGRIYFDLTTPKYIPHHWWGAFAVWDGGLWIWGGVALAAVAGAWRVRRAGADTRQFMDAVAPALLVAQAIGRVGNYFNQELFGGPTSLPWGLQIAPQFRPAGYQAYATFQLTFLYELIFDLAFAALLVWLGHHRHIRPPGLFALYHRVLGIPDLRGIPAGGPVRAFPGLAPERLCRIRPRPGRCDLVPADPAQSASCQARGRGGCSASSAARNRLGGAARCS